MPFNMNLHLTQNVQKEIEKKERFEKNKKISNYLTS